MKISKHGKVKRGELSKLMSLLNLAVIFAAVPTAAFSEVRPPANNPPAVPSGATGMTIYLDPQTGKFLKEPAPGHVPLQLSPQLQNALSTSHEGLFEVPSSVPGGGVKLDLQGRFQSPLIVTVDANGKLTMQHLNGAPSLMKPSNDSGTLRQ